MKCSFCERVKFETEDFITTGKATEPQPYICFLCVGQAVNHLIIRETERHKPQAAPVIASTQEPAPSPGDSYEKQKTTNKTIIDNGG